MRAAVSHSAGRKGASALLVLAVSVGFVFTVFANPDAAVAACGNSIVRVSVSSSGVQGSTWSGPAAISADGRYVVFFSHADNLVPNDVHPNNDIFVRDVLKGTTTLVSVTSAGVQPMDGYVQSPAIFGNGRFAAFVSTSAGMAAGDTNGVPDVFVRDLLAGTTTRVSVGTGGTQANAGSFLPALSADGRYITFFSEADNLVSGDTNGVADVFVRDLVADTTTRVSVATDLTQAAGASGSPLISADGRYITFYSEAENLVAGDVNGCEDVFIRDRVNGTTDLVSVSTTGEQGNRLSGGACPVSADGQYVVFVSEASNLVAGDTNAAADIFIRNRAEGTTELVSIAGGVPGNGASWNPSMSADGRYVAFESMAANLVAGDTNDTSDVFVRDTVEGTTARVSVSASGAQANADSVVPCLSADGAYVVFQSDASNLVAGDVNPGYDVYVHDCFAQPSSGIINDTSAGVTFDRFVACASSAHSGGTYVYGRWTGTRLEARFTGTKIAWIGPKQPSYGKADVYIDGSKVATVDCYAPAASAALSTTIWESGTLSAGTHVISIRLTGQKNAAATGNVVVIDELQAWGIPAAGAGTRADQSAATFSGSWIDCANSAYTGSGYRYSRWVGARVRYTFTGTKVAWIGPRASNYGRANVYIDGVNVATVSQYGALGWRYRVWESMALPTGTHTIEIRVLGTKDAASTGTIVVVDGFDVTP